MGIIAVSMGILVTCGAGLGITTVYKFLHSFEMDMASNKKDRRSHARRDINEERFDNMTNRARVNK